MSRIGLSKCPGAAQTAVLLAALAIACGGPCRAATSAASPGAEEGGATPGIDWNLEKVKVDKIYVDVPGEPLNKSIH